MRTDSVEAWLANFSRMIRTEAAADGVPLRATFEDMRTWIRNDAKANKFNLPNPCATVWEYVQNDTTPLDTSEVQAMRQFNNQFDSLTSFTAAPAKHSA